MPRKAKSDEGLEALDPKKLRVEWDELGYLKVVVQAKAEYTRVKTIQSFPFSKPSTFIVFRGHDNEEIGVLEDVAALDRKSRKVLEAELEKTYFVPKITRVNDIEDDLGVPKWNVETDRGPRRFELKSREDAHSLGRGRVLIKDIDGNKYEIPNRQKLDAQSRALLEQEV